MKRLFEQICKNILVLLTVLLVTSPYLDLKFEVVTSLLGFVILMCTLPLMGKSFKRPSLVFFVLGSGIIILTAQPFLTFVSGINSMLNIVAILIIMQLFSIPIQIGGYDKALEFLLYKRFKRESSLFSFTTVITHLFGSFLLFGTIPVMMALMGRALKNRLGDNYQRLTATAISRGYSLVVLWTPGGVNILLVLQATGATWSDIFLQGVILSFVGIITSSLLERRWMPKGEKILSNQVTEVFEISERESWFRIKDVLLVVISLVVLTLIQERFNNLTSINRIMTAGLLIATVWIIRYVKNPGLSKAFQEYWDNGIIKVIDLAGLFISMGLFSKAIENSGILSILLNTFASAIESAGILSVLVIPVVIIAFALIGLHPFISIILLGNIMASVNLSIPAQVLALSFAIGGAVSYNVSPFAGIVMTMAKYVESEPIKVAFNWNGLFNLVFFIESILLLYLYYVYLAF